MIKEIFPVTDADNSSAEKEIELSDEDIRRIDEVHNAVYDLCRILAESEIEWDMSYIGEIADFAAEVLTKHGFPVRYPAIVYNDEGKPDHIEQYF